MAIDSPELLVSSQSTAEQTSVFTSGALSRLKLIGMLATGATLGVACSSNHFVPPVQAQGTSDTTIINAAATAEALATVMYDNIINTSPAFKQLMTINNVNDQSYLVAGRVQETIHYNTLVGAGAKPLGLTFYYPTGMFTDAGFTTTINTLVTLEDAFIGAYLIGIRDLSTDALKMLAGRILGVEAEHRVLARVIAADLGLQSTTGLSGQAEPVNGPNSASNNIAFERTFSFMTINDVVTALTPFLSGTASGFNNSQPFAYNTSSPNFYITETPTVTLASTSPSA